jgi:hypothetical protein
MHAIIHWYAPVQLIDCRCATAAAAAVSVSTDYIMQTRHIWCTSVTASAAAVPVQ